MKKHLLTLSTLLLIGVLSFSVSAEARTTHVRGYYKPSTGSYVAPHYKTTPNHSRFDNFSTKGNSNPFTGKKGYINPYNYKRK
ncbi:MAG TPA: hypothetical protein VMV71_03115 [Candidatus Paceibacterota bacterium]|nr:hypothetical protein [Candidatus Paceibacterota bacterium]